MSNGAWKPDPSGRHQQRWWDGERWTYLVHDDGVTIDERRATTPPPTCGTCGATTHTGDVFCASCGATLPGRTPTSQPGVLPTPTTTSGLPLVAIVGGFGAALAVIAVIVLLVFGGDGDTETSPGTTLSDGPSPATQPATTEPPATEPPATEAPVTQPPITEPPVTEPPITEPPATDPPTTGNGIVDFGGVEVTIIGSDHDDVSVGAINAAVRAWAEPRGILVTYIGDRDWDVDLDSRLTSGNLPDISILPNPGRLPELARRGAIVPLSNDVVASIREHWSETYRLDGIVDGVQVGVPVSTNLKSLVWFRPALFAAAGYEVPTTYAELEALTRQMADAGGPAPWCVGIESGLATGWVYTDWVEEMVLRLHGGDVYDRWMSNEIPFDDPRIVEAMLAVITLWTGETGEEATRQALAGGVLPRVFASNGTIAGTSFFDSVEPLVDGRCYMHRQAAFFSGLFAPGTRFADGSDGAIDVFYFPDIRGDTPVLISGSVAAAFNDRPATMAVLAYMATGEYAETRQREQARLLDGPVSGFSSAAQGQDPSVYRPLERRFLEILLDAELARFDASDLMPAAVGAGSFWTEGTNIVNGDITVTEGARRIQQSWPR